MRAPAVDPPDPAELFGVDLSRDDSVRAFLTTLPAVDESGLHRQVRRLAGRVLHGAGELAAVEQAIAMVDLTTLEGADTPHRVRALCAQARRPDPHDPTCPLPAAVCVYGDLVPSAVHALQGSSVAVAAVATAFPSGRAAAAVKLADVREAVAAGAQEIDMVIDRGAYLSGRLALVAEQVHQVRALCGDGPQRAHLKVILETGELGSPTEVRRASWLAMLAGADFIKTSTGKISPAATTATVAVMLQAVRDFAAAGAGLVGVKPAGGIRSSADALRLLVAAQEIAGDDWLTPQLLRIGASSLLGDLVRRRRTLREGE